jgi:hypothetical protein
MEEFSILFHLNGKQPKITSFPPNFDEFEKLICLLYKCTFEDIKDMIISYIDDEEDRVVISNKHDYEQAIIFMEKEAKNRLMIDITTNKESPLSTYNSVVSSINFEISPSSILNEYKLPRYLNLNIENNSLMIQDSRQCFVQDAQEKLRNLFEYIMYKKTSILKELFLNLLEMKALQEQSRINYLNSVTIASRPGRILAYSASKISKPHPVEKPMMKKPHLDSIRPIRLAKLVPRVRPVKFEKKESLVLPKISPFRIEKECYKKEIAFYQPKDAISVKERIEHYVSKKLKKLTQKLETKTIKKIDKLIKKQSICKKQEELTFSASCISKSIIHNFSCDECGLEKIEGVRYQCSVCPDYNLCEICEDIISTENSHMHNFIKIRSPEMDTFVSSFILNSRKL